jgi:hypothetical protein
VLIHLSYSTRRGVLVTLQQTTSAATRHICGCNNLFASSTKNDVSPAEESVRDVNDVRSVRIDCRLLLYIKVQMCLGSERCSGPAGTSGGQHTLFKLNRLKFK